MCLRAHFQLKRIRKIIFYLSHFKKASNSARSHQLMLDSNHNSKIFPEASLQYKFDHISTIFEQKQDKMRYQVTGEELIIF